MDGMAASWRCLPTGLTVFSWRVSGFVCSFSPAVVTGKIRWPLTMSSGFNGASKRCRYEVRSRCYPFFHPLPLSYGSLTLIVV